MSDPCPRCRVTVRSGTESTQGRPLRLLQRLWRDLRSGSERCCGRPMRELPVETDLITLLVCDICHDRRWIVIGKRVGAVNALRVAEIIDKAEPTPPRIPAMRDGGERARDPHDTAGDVTGPFQPK